MASPGQIYRYESLPLEQSDVRILMEIITDACDKWEEIGFALELPGHVCSDCKESTRLFSLTKIICEWIKVSVPPATLEKLKSVLETKTVGRNRIASTLVERFIAAKSKIAAESQGSSTPDSEKPILSKEEEEAEIARHQPKLAIEALHYEGICNSVKFILHTVNDNEFNAATTYISAPSNEKGYDVPNTATKIGSSIWVGTFAGHTVGLVKTEQGSKCMGKLKEALHLFPQAKYIIGTGVCYGFDREKTRLGDVIISKKIIDFGDHKCKTDGTIEPRGDRIGMKPYMKEIFCVSPKVGVDEFVLSDKRKAVYHVGNIVSAHILVDNLEMRKKIEMAASSYMGGEMEGGDLLQLQQDGNVEAVIIIKAVVDYADGTKRKEWQYIGAKAAFHYVKCKILAGARSSEPAEVIQ